MTRRPRFRLIAALTVLVLGLLGVAEASASAIPLSSVGAVWHSATFSRPCAGPVLVTPMGNPNGAGKYSQAAVTGLSGSCTTGYLELRDSYGTSLISGTGTISGGVFSVSTSSGQYTPPSAANARLFVSGNTWPIKATWMPSIYGGCTVVVAATGATTTKACSITSLTAVSNGDGAGRGYRTDHLYLALSAPTMATDGSEKAYVVLNLGAASGLPNNWQWGNAGVTTGNLTPYPGDRCSALPMLQAYAPGWAANGAQVYFDALENRTGASGLVCS